MTLPTYFLADLPDSSHLTAGMISDACQTLKKNRETYLAPRSTQSLIRVLANVAKSWLEPNDPFRLLVLAGSETTGFSPETVRAGLDSFFAQITTENLHALIQQEFGELSRMDALCATTAEQKLDRAGFVRGPELIAHIAGGVIPNGTITSMILGLLTRSAQFVKCPSGKAFIPRLFAHSIYDVEPKLGACIEIAEWRGGSEHLETALFNEADCVTATGSDETIETIRQRLPQKTRFLGYGHRVSFGYLTEQVLSGMNSQKIVTRAARDVIAWNQLGCLSPHVFYVENGGKISAEKFAELLAQELAELELREPRGNVSPKEAADVSYRRSFYEVRAAHSLDTKMWKSEGSTVWTVIFENDPRFQISCLNRFIYVKSIADLDQALQGSDSIRGKVSTVGIAATEDRAKDIADKLARWGATRICPLGQMQNPSLLWRHDGRPSLGDLVTWTDWEL